MTARTWPRTAAAACALVALAAALVTLPSSARAADTDAGALTVAVGSEIANPNIWAVNSVSEWEAITMEYDLLMGFSPDDLTAAPGLAESCEPSNDNRTWTCTLREGMTWSDGEPITSSDVVFSYNLVVDQGFGYFKTYIPKGSTFETPDDLTLVWNTPEPSNSPMVPPWVYIVPEHVWGQYADLAKKDLRAVDVVPVVGSGPYQMTEAVDGQRWTFERNPNYWGTPPAYDSVEFVYFDNQQAMVQALRSGEVDVIDGVDAALLPALERESNISVQKVVPDCWNNMAFNFGGQGPDANPLPALQDVEVRKAIAMAIDKQAIVDKVYPNAAEPGETVVRPLATYWHLDIPDDQVIPYDPAAANQMLDDAGYTTGPDGVRVDPSTGQPLVIRMPTSNDTAGSEASGRLIAGFLKQVGITVKVQPVTAGKMYGLQQAGDFDAYIWYWCGDPDPNYQLSVFSSSQAGVDGDYHLSDGNWSDPQYDALYEEQRTILDPAERQKVVFEAQQYIYDQVPVIALVYPNTIQAFRNDRVTDLTPIPSPNGYITPNYSSLPFLDAQPASTTSGGGSSSGSDTGLPVWIWAVVALVVVGAVAGYYVRRRGAEDTEEG